MSTGGPDSGRRDVDRAALLGTALAAVVALTFGGEGEWDWLACAAGVALLAVLCAFFGMPTGNIHPARDRVELAAVSAVAALAATLVVAAPVQALLGASTQTGRDCRTVAAVAAARATVDELSHRAAPVAVELLRADGIVGTADGVLAATARNAQREVYGTCIGAATTRVLPLPASGLAVAIFLVLLVRLHRSGPDES